MRFDIRYRTHFAYSAPVLESHNQLRACPVNDERQWLLSYRVDVWPLARVQAFEDYFGTRVDEFGVRDPHDHLDVVAHATVQTSDVEPPAGADRAELAADTTLADRFYEYLEPGRHTDWTAPMRRVAVALVDGDGGGGSQADAVRRVHAYVNDHLDYEPGVTDITTTAAEAWEDGRGVCQDYSHLAVTLCRSVGIPARYVSGYLFTLDETSAEPDAVPEGRVEVQTHAWFEAYVGDGDWLGLDPTGGVEVGRRHVKIGHGRDYDDVTPFHGTYVGSADADLAVSVEMERVGGTRSLVPTPAPMAAADRRASRPIRGRTDGHHAAQ